MTRVAIMQPAYLPWLGYFSLMDCVDHFVFLDSVQFNKRSWQQRNRIKTPTGLLWLTVPVQKKGKSDQCICDALIDKERSFEKNHMATISQAYAKAPYFKVHRDALFGTFEPPHDRLADLTINICLALAGTLEIKPLFVRSSELDCTGSKDELLANICEILNADTYISPIGSFDYLHASPAFAARGIKILYNDYRHPEYSQINGSFEPFMPAIDLIFNEGGRSIDIIRSGQNLRADDDMAAGASHTP